MNHSQAIVEALVAQCADHWQIHHSLILGQGRACREAAWSRFAIVRVLDRAGFTHRQIADAFGRTSGLGGRDRTQWVRTALQPRYENEEVRLLAAILGDVLSAVVKPRLRTALSEYD